MVCKLLEFNHYSGGRNYPSVQGYLLTHFSTNESLCPQLKLSISVNGKTQTWLSNAIDCSSN